MKRIKTELKNVGVGEWFSFTEEGDELRIDCKQKVIKSDRLYTYTLDDGNYYYSRKLSEKKIVWIEDLTTPS